MRIGHYGGRIGSLGNFNIVGAQLPNISQLLAGGGMPSMPAGIHPAIFAAGGGVRPGGMPYGAPPGGQGLAGPVPDMSVQMGGQQDAYALVLPVPSTGSLAAAAAANLTMTPQRPMRIERFVTTAAASVFTISNFQAGVDNQFIAAGAVDAAVFGAGAFGVALRGSTVYPGITISMTVTNISAAAATAQGWAFIGTAIA